MLRLRFAAVSCLATLLIGCQQDASFRREGAGADLYYAEMVTRTANLNAYFDSLCAQADIQLTVGTQGVPPTCNTAALTEAQWGLVVRAGYNDIDARCDTYLSWLEAKRNERLFANQTSAALAGLLGGILTGAGGAEALGYVALALGFGGTIYNAYQDSLLLGLETSTIKTIVTERRLQFQNTFREARYASKPDAVGALRAYLRICTPATITMDVNTYSRLAAAGQPNNQPSLQQRELQADRQALSTYRPTAAMEPANQTRQRGAPQMPDALRQVVVGDWNMADVRALQTAFCLPEADRGQTTEVAIARMRANIPLAVDRTRSDRRITRADFGRIQFATADRATGQVTCPVRFQNYTENFRYRSSATQERRDLEDLRKIVGEPEPAPQSFEDARARELIGRARVRCRLDNTGPFRNQVDNELAEKLDEDEPCRS